MQKLNNFYFVWIFIEFRTLIFIGLSYTLFVNSFSQLISYFLIQALAGLGFLFGYVSGLSFIFTFSIFLKLGMFPFSFWFVNLIYRFPGFIFWLSSTLQKLPMFYLISFFNLPLNFNLLYSRLLLSVFFRGLLIIYTVDFRSLLVFSSIGNNSWFFMSRFLNFLSFSLFFLFYSLFLIFALFVFSNIYKFSKTNLNTTYQFSFYILSLSGLPPFPLFFVKIFVIYSLFFSMASSFLVVFLALNFLMVIGYIINLFNFYVYSYSNKNNFLFMNFYLYSIINIWVCQAQELFLK
jgi:hypothetical protein